MPAIFSILLRIALPLLAGLGVGELIDKFRIPIPDQYKPVKMPLKSYFRIALWSVISFFILRFILRRTGLSRTIKL